ncbi:MAG: hypothetical protein DMG86_22180 [Acidobacteria bacterium]|nr:MAG: hypothetical protein DMG86_22180 [Acidobacteriota bacterium]
MAEKIFHSSRRPKEQNDACAPCEIIAALISSPQCCHSVATGVTVSLALFILMIVGFALSLWPEKKTRPVDEANSESVRDQAGPISMQLQ